MLGNSHRLNVDAIINWPFLVETKGYSEQDARRYAEGFGAGLSGGMFESDQALLAGGAGYALPMIAVPLADGEFWHADSRTGIAWQQMVHVGESITVHRPLPAAATLQLTQKVDQILDRGEGRGAIMLQQLNFADEHNQYVTIDVTMLLRGNGGFGGEPDNRPREKWVPDDRPADLSVDLLTPRNDPNNGELLFELKIDLAVAAGGASHQKPLRGVCAALAWRGGQLCTCYVTTGQSG